MAGAAVRNKIRLRQKGHPLMMPSLDLPPGYRSRPPNLADAPAVAGLRAAGELADWGQGRTTAEEVRDEWSGLDLDDEAVLVTSGAGDVAAYADILNRAFVLISVYGQVHPDHRGRGLGTLLVEWGEAWVERHLAHAPAGARVAIQHYVAAPNEPARQLLESRDYQPVRSVYEMAIHFEEPPAAAQWPAGILVRPFVPGRDERTTYEAYEEASEDMWGRPRGTFEAWLAYTERADPAFLFVAEDAATGEVAAVNACSLTEGRGYVGGLRVRPAWRRRGLGLALLRHAFGEFYIRGAREAGLSVDAASPTNAPSLYLQAGMQVVRTYVVFRKILRPGNGGDHG
jgi:GNAT superfamily N-acetyltransferase